MALGDKVKSPTSKLYCGGTATTAGNLPECAKRVLASLVAAGDALAKSSNSDDPAVWNADAQGERILFLPGVALSMQWVNRPTTQQLAMFGRLGRHPPRVSGASAAPCATRRTFASIGAQPRGRGLRIRVRARRARPVRVDLLRVSSGRRVLAGVPVRRFGARKRDFRWNGRARHLVDGYYVLRFRGRDADGRRASRRIALRRIRGRFHTMHTFERRRACGALESFALRSSVFGRGRALAVRFRLAERATVAVQVRRGGRVVRRTKARRYAAGVHRVRFAARRLRRGDYTVRLVVRGTPPLAVRARRL